MYRLLFTKQYEKSLLRLRQGKSWNEENIRELLRFLRSSIVLPSVYKDHQLKGDMAMYRECHLKHDVLLQYFRWDVDRAIVWSTSARTTICSEDEVNCRESVLSPFWMI